MLLSRDINVIPLFIVYICGFTGVANAIDLKTGVDEQAQLPYWEISTGGMSLRLIQRLPIQTRGYFMARGFKAKQAERIAQSCLFQTIFKNISDADSAGSPSNLEYNLHGWLVKRKGTRHRPKTREDWSKEWQAEKVSQAAQIAFEWSLYPTQQEYKPGDYNWGMTIFNLKPGMKFDLDVSWKQYGKLNKSSIKGIECAPDINPQSKESR